MIANWFKRQKRDRFAVDRLHQSILGQALRPEFYFAGGARDNFSGRFEMAALHATLLFRRLRRIEEGGQELSQELFDALFDGFDEALRDIGTADLAVGKKIRKMGEAFYGRAKAYDSALQTPDNDALERALVRNLTLDAAVAPLIATYVRSIEDAFSRHADAGLMSGDLTWPKPPSAALRAVVRENPAGARAD